MNMTLQDFVKQWNENRDRKVRLTLQGEPNEQPLGLEIRFSPTKYRHEASDWEEMSAFLDGLSRHSMQVVTGQVAFASGVVTVKFATMKHNFNQRFIMTALQWLGKEFFPARRMY